MILDILLDGISNGFFWLPFVLGVGLLYKNLKIIDVSIDGVAILSMIAFVVSWNLYNSFLLAFFCTLSTAIICYTCLSFFIYELKINALFAGIIFSLILHSISVIIIGESLSLQTNDNYLFFSRVEKIIPFCSIALLIVVDIFFRTKKGISIRIIGENRKANTGQNKRILLLIGFVITGFLVGYGAFGYVIKESVARSGGGFDFVVNSLASFLLVDKFIDYFIVKYKKRKEKKKLNTSKYYYLFSFLQSSVFKAFVGSLLFQIIVVFIIVYTSNPVYWKLFFGIALILTVAKFNFKRPSKPILLDNSLSGEEIEGLRIQEKRNTIAIGENDSSVNIDINKLDFSYKLGHENKVVFENFSAKFSQGINIIRGENGIGKTTLLRLINGEIYPNAGEITISNSRNGVFFLRQDPISIFAKDLTVYENVISIIPELKNSSISSSKQLVKTVNSIIVKYKLNFDFLNDDAIWLKQISHLSGGQIQKIACLMAFLSDSRVVLADEPSSGLDNNNIEVLRYFFYKLSEQGKIVIIITHDNRLFYWDSKQYCLETNRLSLIN